MLTLVHSGTSLAASACKTRLAHPGAAGRNARAAILRHRQAPPAAQVRYSTPTPTRFRIRPRPFKGVGNFILSQTFFMKKVRNILVASALISGVSGIFAFKVSRQHHSGTLWHIVGGFCVQDKTCAAGSGGIQCTGTYFSSQVNTTTCAGSVLPSNTHWVTD